MPFGPSKSAHPEDEDAIQQDTPDGNAEESANAVEGAGDGDGQETSAPADNGQTEGEPYKRMSFRPDYLDDTAPREGATATATAIAEARPLPQGDAFFVCVTRDGVSDLHRFDSAAEAQAFVEEQLGGGVQQEDVTAFSGRKLAFNVSHRPIVKLLTQED
ncbi:MAG: hypothetical protein Q8Q00_06500 [Dehalococcoidia bacterium]|nr:hypothetical protein [Dehalococcoidia bacterium]